MGLVDDRFRDLKSNLEISPSEQRLASLRQTQIRDHLQEHLDLDRTFLTGSYARHTKTKKLKDVDIFCVVKSDGADAGLRDKTPWDILNDLQGVLALKYTSPVPSIGRRSCSLKFSDQDEVPTFDVVVAFDRAAGGYEIPDRLEGHWIATDPQVHKAKATAKNAECNDKWIPLVKMIKGWNREWDKPVRPSFLLEVMALELVKTPFTNYADEIVLFLSNAADRITDVWPDPAGLGPDVNSSMTTAEKHQAAVRLREALATAERAVDLNDECKERAAVDAWRELFGRRMPAP
jgi:predicted nucleotidyltransferase